MFTGLVQGLVEVVSVKDVGDSREIAIRLEKTDSPIELGESIAIDGCCLTVVSIEGAILTFQAGDETLAKTTLGQFKLGSMVNVERAMRPMDRFGGHIVSGHIDCVGQVIERIDHDDWADFRFQMPTQFMGQVAPKGSIAVNGVSLTVVDVGDDWLTVALIPHTLAVTNLGSLHEGSSVNLETDTIAKYVQRLMNRD
jgi:riboflavin synthase